MRHRSLLPGLFVVLFAWAAPVAADVFSDERAPADFRPMARRDDFDDDPGAHDDFDSKARPGDFSDVRPGEPADEDIELVESYEPSAGAVVGALAINLVYVPVRFAITVVGAIAGGFEGIFSVGNEEAAETIFGLTDGSQVITPAMLEGRERWTFSRYGW